ncbi:unnamed protein product [Arctogadus glacialis]
MLWYTNTCILSVFTCSPPVPAVFCCNLLYSAVLIVPPGHLSPRPPPPLLNTVVQDQDATHHGGPGQRQGSWVFACVARLTLVGRGGLPSCMCFFKRVLLFRYLV